MSDSRGPVGDRKSLETERVTSDVPPGPSGGEILLLRSAVAARDPDLEKRLGETGYHVESEALAPRTIAATVAAPPALVVLDLEPFDPALLDFARALREQLARFAPAILAFMRADDESNLGQALDAGVKDVLERTTSSALLKVKVARYARRAEGSRGTGSPRAA